MLRIPHNLNLSPEMSSVLSHSYGTSYYSIKESLDVNKKLRIQRVQFDNPIVKLNLEPQSIILMPSMNEIHSPIDTPKTIFSRMGDTKFLEKQKKFQKDSYFFTSFLPSVQNSLFKIMIRKRFIDTFITNLKRWSYIYDASLLQNSKLLQEEYLIQKETDQKLNVHEIQTHLQHQSDLCLIKLFIIAQKITYNASKISVFEPLSLFMIIWKTVRTIIQLLIFWFVPFLLSFQIGSLSIIWDIQVILLIVLVLDDLIQLNLAFISRGQVVRLREKIQIHYVKKHALKDIFEVGSLFLIFIFQKQPWIILIVLIYLYLSIEKMAYTVSSVQEYFHFNGTMNEAISLIKLIIVLLLTSHTCACLWHFVGQQSLQNGYNSWISSKNLVEATIFSRYNYSFYWATMTMVTVGYGDVSPENDLEVIVASCTMFVTCGVFAYAINAIGNSLSNIQEQKAIAKKAFAQINQYMSSNQVNNELQGRVRNYLEYCFKQDRDVDYEDVEYIFEKLPSNIKQELTRQIRGKALAQCKVINQTLSQEVQNQLLPLMERQRFSPEEVIFKENSLDDNSIYMIQQGEVELICNDRVLQKLQIGDSFGERSFFTSQIRCCTVKAVDFVKVYKLTQDSALKILFNHPTDKEKWCNIRDQIGLYEQYGGAKMSCYSCGRSNHLVRACPTLFYKPDLERIIKQEAFRDGQDRSQFTRQGYKQSSLSINKLLQDQTKQYRIENLNMEEDENDDSSQQEESLNNLTNQQAPSQLLNLEQLQDAGSMRLSNSVPQLIRSITLEQTLSKRKTSWSSQNSSQSSKQDIDIKESLQIPNQNDNINRERDREIQEKYKIIQNNHHPKAGWSEDNSSNFKQKTKRPPQQNNFLISLPPLGAKPGKKDNPKQLNILGQSARYSQKKYSKGKIMAQNFHPPGEKQDIKSVDHFEIIENKKINIVDADRLQSQNRANKLESNLAQGSSLSSIIPQLRDGAKPFRQSSFNPDQIGSQDIVNQFADVSVDLSNIFQTNDIDIIHQFNHYFQHNNFKSVIKQQNRFIKQKNTIMDSRYTLYYSVKKRAQRIQRILKKYQTQ